jgi:hypothetical protein
VEQSWLRYPEELRMRQGAIHQLVTDEEPSSSTGFASTGFVLMGYGEDTLGRFTGLKVNAERDHMPDFVTVHACELCVPDVAGDGCNTRTLFICDCAVMRSAWTMPELCNEGAGSLAAIDGIPICRHSRALQQLLANDMHTCRHSPEQTAQTLLEIVFSSSAEGSVTILDCTPGPWYNKTTPAVCLSVDCLEHPCACAGSHPARGIITTTAQLAYRCRTCETTGTKMCAHLSALEVWLDRDVPPAAVPPAAVPPAAVPPDPAAAAALPRAA